MPKKVIHDIIQHTAKEKRASCIVTGFLTEGKVITGSQLYKKLFTEVDKKFNPKGLNNKIIQSDGI